MRRIAQWLVALSVVTGGFAGTTSVSAQPTVRDHRGPNTPPPPPPADREHERDHRRPPPPGEGPMEAPPAPRAETPTARAGFVWIPGRWDWRGKWEWVAGHEERERAGKKWREGRWDKQGDRWAYVEGTWTDGEAPPPAADGRPREAPPPPRDEQSGVRAGFVWIRGRWDWRTGKWEWIPGHWERERAGKQWREARWEQRDGAWALVDGDWVDVGTAPPPPMPPEPAPPDGHDQRDRHERHHEWKLDRPMVSSYWPLKGKVGSRIVIRGRNFPNDTVVLWGGTQVTGAKVGPEEIVVAVPPGAASGMLSLHTGHGRDLAVGNYEVADYDAAAEARRQAAEAQKRAEQEWAERQKQLSKDRAARLAAAEKRRHEFEETREQRRADREKQIREQWEAAFLADPDTQAELTLHAQRGAELDRMREVAELSENGKLVVRIGVAKSREDDRHEARMSALHDAFGRKP